MNRKLLLPILLVLMSVAVLAQASGHDLSAGVSGTFSAQTKILTIIGGVYALLQAVKKFVPVKGYLAVALNVVFSVLGVVTVVQPQDLFSLNTLVAVLTAAAGAAGIHGTVSKLSNPAG